MNEPLWSAALQVRAQGRRLFFHFWRKFSSVLIFVSKIQAKIIAQNKRMWVTTLLKEVSFRL